MTKETGIIDFGPKQAAELRAIETEIPLIQRLAQQRVADLTRLQNTIIDGTLENFGVDLTVETWVYDVKEKRMRRDNVNRPETPAHLEALPPKSSTEPDGKPTPIKRAERRRAKKQKPDELAKVEPQATAAAANGKDPA